MKTLILIFALSLNAVVIVNAQQKYSCSPNEIAFYGNDLTTYYDGEGKLLQGKKEFSLEYDGLNLQFASNANREKFKKNPDKYLPEYGGWCAIALTSNALIQPDFNHYKVQNGELLFFEVRAFFNGKTAWERDPDINKIVADKKFGEIFKN